MAATKLVTAIVAPRKTVFIGAEKRQVWDADTKRQVDQVKASRPAGPGTTVELPEDEVKRLRAAGFLIDPRAEVIPVGDGPNFGVASAPVVQAD